jgi:hypothetical protein
VSALAPDAAVALLESARRKLPNDLIEKLSAPFVLSALEPAKRRLLVFGQETFGWGGANPNAPEGRLGHWLDQPAQVAAEGLAKSYAELFSSGGSSTPFWDAKRTLVDALGGAWTVTWSNLMRVDTSPLSTKHGWRTFSTWWNLSYREVDEICAWQAPLHRAELNALRPDAVLFLTGPHYDYCIGKNVEICRVEGVLGRTARTAGRLTGLQPKAFRTYHPNYLRRSGQWELLQQMAKLIADGCA